MAVPYEAGTLRAVGVTGVKSVEAQCSTTGSFEKLILHADKKNLQAGHRIRQFIWSCFLRMKKDKEYGHKRQK